MKNKTCQDSPPDLGGHGGVRAGVGDREGLELQAELFFKSTFFICIHIDLRFSFLAKAKKQKNIHIQSTGKKSLFTCLICSTDFFIVCTVF